MDDVTIAGARTMKGMGPRHLLAAAAAAAGLVALGGCRAREPPPASSGLELVQRAATTTPPAAGPTLEGEADAASASPKSVPAEVERVDVGNDRPAAVVRGEAGKAPRLVFLPGVCSSAYAYLLSFAEAARAHGGIVAIDGDLPCGAPNSGFHSFSWDPVLQDRRLQAALAAARVGGERGEPPEPPKGLTLVGYSAGAGIGELMVQRWPERYARVVLIGAPGNPSPLRLSQARAVVTMSCSRDVPGRMRDAARRISAAGVPATYLEMPGCTHGNIADGERVFETAFDWLSDNSKASEAP